MTSSGQALVELSALSFPLDHFITNRFDYPAWIADYQATFRYFFSCLDKGERSNNTFRTHYHFVHDYCIHPYHYIAPDVRTVNDGAMTNVRTFL